MARWIRLVALSASAVMVAGTVMADPRIMSAVPSEQCVFKLQEVCKKNDAGCYGWFQKRAARRDANVIVMPLEGAAMAVADYYHCPEPNDHKEFDPVNWRED